MRGFHARFLYSSLVLFGLTFSALAQNSGNTYRRGPSSPPSGAVPAVQPVSVYPLPDLSPEAVGLPDADGLGADVWKGTPRDIAERLLSSLSPSSSPILNELVLRLLKTSALPPAGETQNPQLLTSKRVEKIALFGDAAGAWSLAQRADAKLVDAATFRLAAESASVAGDESICAQAPDLARTHPGADWQEFLVVCRLRAKDNQAAQVSLDILRSEGGRDETFLSIADGNILGGGKVLPSLASPVTLETLALLQSANLPLPDSFFARADYAGARALLKVPAQKDAARLAFAERAAGRGIVEISELGEAYRATVFSAAALASPPPAPPAFAVRSAGRRATATKSRPGSCKRRSPIRRDRPRPEPSSPSRPREPPELAENRPASAATDCCGTPLRPHATPSTPDGHRAAWPRADRPFAMRSIPRPRESRALRSSRA